MIERRRWQAVVLFEPRRYRPSDRVDRVTLAEHGRVEAYQVVAQPDILFGVTEIAVGRAAQFVGGPVLMHQPGHFPWMAGEVGRKLRGDHHVDRPAVALAQIQQAPRGRVRQDLVLRIPLEGDADQLGEMAAVPQFAHELAHENLGAAVHERNLRFENEDPLHG